MRARLSFYACLIVALFLAWRLYDVQAVKGAIYAREALAQRSDTVEVFARRGSILDRGGNVLVRSMPSESVYAVPREIVDADATVTKLERIVGKLDAATVAALHDRHSGSSGSRERFRTRKRRASVALGLLGVDLKEEADRSARRYRRTSCVDGNRLRRNRRERTRRRRVRV